MRKVHRSAERTLTMFSRTRLLCILSASHCWAPRYPYRGGTNGIANMASGCGKAPSILQTQASVDSLRNFCRPIRSTKSTFLFHNAAR